MSFQLDVLNFKINCIFCIMAIVRKWLYINEIPHLSLLSNVIFFIVKFSQFCVKTCFYIFQFYIFYAVNLFPIYIRATRISEWSDAPCVRDAPFVCGRFAFLLVFEKRRTIKMYCTSVDINGKSRNNRCILYKITAIGNFYVLYVFIW